MEPYAIAERQEDGTWTQVAVVFAYDPGDALKVLDPGHTRIRKWTGKAMDATATDRTGEVPRIRFFRVLLLDPEQCRKGGKAT